jgi:hypothetical protein
MSEGRRTPRWGTRQEGMQHGKFGATHMNELMKAGKILAKMDGNKVKVDLNSIDDHILSLPDVGAAHRTDESAKTETTEENA